jgi:anaerobic selenocysteine-containing dehydrogenase
MDMGIVEKKSFCRVCGSGCGIVVELDGQQVIKVRGDEDHVMTRGYTCPKGRALAQHHHAPNRLNAPLIRENGVLRETSWEHLLDDLGAKLKRIIEESGPRAVGMFVGGGGYLDAGGCLSARSFATTLKTPSIYSDNSVDNLGKVFLPELMCGIPGLMYKTDLQNCKMVLFIGTNPVISHGHVSTLNVPSARLRELKARGETWVIDPRKTETADRATRYLPARPGTDYAILAYLVRELLRDGADHDYIKKHTQDVGKLRQAMEPFTVERASRISGLPSQDLMDLLASVRRIGKISVETGTGVTMSAAGNVTQWLSLVLMIITGSMDREGGAWVSPGFHTRLDKLDIPTAPPEGWPRPGPESRPELPSIVGEYPCAALPDEIEAGHLRAMCFFGGNIPALPEVKRTVAALKKLDVLVAIDVRPTETTEIATHVIAAKDQLERADMTYVTEFFYPYLLAQYTPAMVEPVGQRKGVWWALSELGKRMGVEFFPGFDTNGATDDDMLAYIAGKGQSGYSFEEIKARRVITEAPPIGWLTRHVDEKVGGWRLAPALVVEQISTLEDPAPLVLIPRRQKHHENSKFLDHADQRDKPCIFVSPDDAESAGLKDGATIEVRSKNGALQGVMKIDRTLCKGAMTVPHGWSGQYNVNNLTGTVHDVDPVTGMVRYSGLPVSLHPV